MGSAMDTSAVESFVTKARNPASDLFAREAWRLLNGAYERAMNCELDALGSMLLGAIFHDAMGREMMPQIYPAQAKAPRLYSRLLLNAIGYKTGNGGTR